MNAGRFEFPDTAGYRCRMLEGGALKPNIRHPFHEAFLPHRGGSSATFTKIKPVASLVHDVEFSLLDFGFEELPIELDTAMGWRDRVICRIHDKDGRSVSRILLNRGGIIILAKPRVEETGEIRPRFLFRAFMEEHIQREVPAGGESRDTDLVRIDAEVGCLFAAKANGLARIRRDGRNVNVVGELRVIGAVFQDE